jgi:6-phosphogluconolactonase
MLTSLTMTSLLAQTGESYLIAGTYTKGKSKGIYIFRFNQLRGDAVQVSVTGEINNPSFLAVSPDRKSIYAVSELNGNHAGKVYAYAFDAASGTLKKINEQPSGGDDPCFVTVDRTGKWVITGNYSSGALSVLPVRADAGLEQATTTLAHEGKGPVTDRQEKAHVHATVLSADNRFLYAPDLGIDRVMIYRFDDGTGRLEPAEQPWFQAPAGSGPRHISFDKDGRFAYLLEELSGSVSVLACDPQTGRLSSIQHISTLPEGFRGFAGSAEILVSPDGKFVYASNRGDSHTIAIFQRNPKTGKLSLAGHQPTLGKSPRNFNFDPSGNYLLVANQDSDEVVIFKRNLNTGLLADTGNRISIPSPVCIRWVRSN